MITNLKPRRNGTTIPQYEADAKEDEQEEKKFKQFTQQKSVASAPKEEKPTTGNDDMEIPAFIRKKMGL